MNDVDRRIAFVVANPLLAEQIDKAMANTAKAIRAQRCPICNQPIESDHPKADVYHMSCMMEQMRPQREKQQLNRKRAVATPDQEE